MIEIDPSPSKNPAHQIVNCSSVMNNFTTKHGSRPRIRTAIRRSKGGGPAIERAGIKNWQGVPVSRRLLPGQSRVL
jgi:hypothetical protein